MGGSDCEGMMQSPRPTSGFRTQHSALAEDSDTSSLATTIAGPSEFEGQVSWTFFLDFPGGLILGMRRMEMFSVRGSARGRIVPSDGSPIPKQSTNVG